MSNGGGSNGFQGSSAYGNDPQPSSSSQGADAAADAAGDPASSSFFISNYKKHDDLKQMLDSNKDNLKLESMKRIIGMVAKGKDASDLFPAVVKNVVSKNIEVKKLVYVYLTRYAEEQQDLALLSISTFQKALKDPNQLIRASALRVLSSIRVTMIVPIMMLAIKESVTDMSPYVRKTAAHAIPKLYSLDPEQKDILIEVIQRLLADKTTLVAGSAIQAFEEVCPERIDLIHKNYRKLCNLLVDVEEWGQVVIVNMLTRYCRMQFVNPNEVEAIDDSDHKTFYDSSENSDKEFDRSSNTPPKKPYVMDSDHRLLLRICRPLLNSRNAAVVMAVAQLYHHCAPKSEVGTVAKALIRLLRSPKEVQYVILSNIASMSVRRKSMFEPYLKSFYVRSNDPTHVKLLKLEILTNLATEANISTILREFQTYVTSSDKDFAGATIQAIGRCASTISEVTDTCLNGLVNLLSNRNEAVVGESVVIIKKLLQMRPTEHKEIISHMAKMADVITVPMARASILWLIGEYSDRVPKIAPDVLRKMAKTFVSEEDIVKLQILNLASKLCITNSKQTKTLCQYVFNLAKYDQNYDIRDRARFLRQLILPGEKAGILSKHAKKIFLASKPAPVLDSKFKDLDHFQLGTLSHMINLRANGYQELPDWPEVAPDPSVRNVETVASWTDMKSGKKKPERKNQSFYSDEESSSPVDESSKESTSEEPSSGSEEGEAVNGDGGSSSSSSGSEEELESSEEASRTDEEDAKVQTKVRNKKAKSSGESSGASSSDDSEGESSSEEEREQKEEDVQEEKPVPVKKSKQKRTESKLDQSREEPSKPSDLLLDLDDFIGPGPSVGLNVTSAVDILMPVTAQAEAASSIKPKPNYSKILGTTFSPTASVELLNRVIGSGLSVSCRFTRTISIFSQRMVSIELTFVNASDKAIEGIRIGDKKLAIGMRMEDFGEIASLAPGSTTRSLLSIDFNETTQPVQFDLCTSAKKFSLSITAAVGELLRPNTLNEREFLTLQSKLGGMNESTGSVVLPSSNLIPQTICNKVYETANVLLVPSSEDQLYLFAAKTISTDSDVLVSVRVSEGKANIRLNCEKLVIGSMLIKDLKTALGKV